MRYALPYGLVAVPGLSLLFSVSPMLQVLVLLLATAAQADVEHTAVALVLLVHDIEHEIARESWLGVVFFKFFSFWDIWC